jgi:hypothetical protein
MQSRVIKMHSVMHSAMHSDAPGRSAAMGAGCMRLVMSSMSEIVSPRPIGSSTALTTALCHWRNALTAKAASAWAALGTALGTALSRALGTALGRAGGVALIPSALGTALIPTLAPVQSSQVEISSRQVRRAARLSV